MSLCTYASISVITADSRTRRHTVRARRHCDLHLDVRLTERIQRAIRRRLNGKFRAAALHPHSPSLVGIKVDVVQFELQVAVTYSFIDGDLSKNAVTATLDAVRSVLTALSGGPVEGDYSEPGLAERLYSVATAMYSAEFRDEFGAQLLAHFRTEWAERKTDRWTWFVRELFVLVWCAIVERLHAMREAQQIGGRG